MATQRPTVLAAVLFLPAASASAQPFQDQTQLLPGTGLSLYTKFGQSVGIDADTVAVGHPSGFVGGISSGVVSIFTRNGQDWGNRIDLLPHDRYRSMAFGESLAISGDYLLAAGVRSYTGEAYVFERTGGVWSEKAKFVPTFSPSMNCKDV